MKKSVLLLAAAFGVSGAFAQDLTSKKGEPFLPEAGDWAISVDATPFLNYAGNMLSSKGNTAPQFHFLGSSTDSLGTSSPMIIMGKMFKDEKTAYRASLRIGYNSDKFTNEVSEFTTTAATPITTAMTETAAKKVDKGSVTNRYIGVGGGLEFRRGKTRLQGFYGAEALIWGQSKMEKYKYANALVQNADPLLQFDANNSAYSTQSFINSGDTLDLVETNITGYTNVDEARVLKRKTKGEIGIGVRGFIGAEYFIFPKIAIGGEFGWGVGYVVQTKNKATWDAEGKGTAAGAVQEAKEIKTKDQTNGGSGFMIDTSNKNNFIGASGNIRLTFHF